MSLQVTHGIDIGHTRIICESILLDVWLFGVLVASILWSFSLCSLLRLCQLIAGVGVGCVLL